MGTTVDYHDFIRWLSVKLRSVPIHLKIVKRRKRSRAIDANLHDVEAVLKHYAWKASWPDPAHGPVDSEDWDTTKASLRRLRARLRSACAAEDNSDRKVLAACKSIVTWGGDRNSDVGAMPFLENLARREGLKAYLWESKKALRLASPDGPAPGEIRKMNSMLSKVHALFAEDGLPIYDSRVAAAAACFVEMYRHETGIRADIPESLSFPSVGGGGKRRSVKTLFPDCQDAETIGYNKKKEVKIAHQWARAKWHLGRVFLDVLAAEPPLFANEGDISARAHALEASFFMIGYDVKCLARL